MTEETPPKQLEDERDEQATSRPQPDRRQLLEGITTVGLGISLAGCSSFSETTSESQAAAVLLTGAPNGLQKFEATIQTAGDVSITEITPGVIDGNEFQIVSGGVGENTVSVRAADLSDSVGSFNDDRTLVTATFDTAIDSSSIDLSTSQVTNDNGETIPQENIQLNLSE